MNVNISIVDKDAFQSLFKEAGVSNWRKNQWKEGGVMTYGNQKKEQVANLLPLGKYLALIFPAVWPKAPTVGAGGSLQYIRFQIPMSHA